MQGDNDNPPDPTLPDPPPPAADSAEQPPPAADADPPEPVIPGAPVEVRVGGRASTRVQHVGVISRRKIDGNADDPPPSSEE